MKFHKQRIYLSLGLALLAAIPLAAQVVPAPETVLGFVPGTDRKLVEWPVEARVGEGRIVMFGFRPQYRAQSIGTCPLFFNALKARRDASTP